MINSLLFQFFVESIIYGLGLYLIYIYVVEKRSSYRFQRGYLLCSMMFSTVMPFIQISMPKAPSVNILLPEIIVKSIPEGFSQVEQVQNNFSFESIVGFYFLISAIIALSILLQFMKVITVISTGKTIYDREYRIVMVGKTNSPYSFFKTIVIDDSLEKKELDYVILHEKVHIQQKHSFDLIFTAFIFVIQWFNPFIYLLKNSLISVHEFEADKEVINKGTSIKSYREILIKQQLGFTPIIVNALNKSLTIKRLKKMENLNQKSNKFFTVLITAILTVGLFIVISSTNISIAQNVKKVLKTETKTITDTTKSKKILEKSFESLNEVPFTEVEVKPTFMGGDENTFVKWVFSKLVYPESAKVNKIQGRVILQFLVDEKGDVKDVKVRRGVNNALDNEAIRVVSSSPQWTPGMMKGKVVPVRYTFPVIFMLK